MDVSKDKLKIRRKENKALPDAGEMRKRDGKAHDKSEAKKKAEPEDRFDDKGNFILTEKDFSDPVIVYYKANVDGKEEFKVDWKKAEQHVKATFKKLKLIYARGG